LRAAEDNFANNLITSAAAPDADGARTHLPETVMPTETKEASEPEILSFPTRGPGLLIVDADRAMRLELAQDFTAAGFTVWTAPSGEAAVDAYLRHTGEIHVLLISLSLPDLPAVEFLSWLRRHYPGVPCCCLAGPDDRAAAARVKAAGGLVLLRPLSFHRLAAVIRRLASDAAQPEPPDNGTIFTEWQVAPGPGRAG
jgi:DNA-binding response OmpR family regulator